MILKQVGEIRKAFLPFDWSIFLVPYLLAIAAATLLRAVAIAAAIARATVVQMMLVAQAIDGIATSKLGLDVLYYRKVPKFSDIVFFFSIVYLKFIKRGQTFEYFVNKMQME